MTVKSTPQKKQLSDIVHYHRKEAGLSRKDLAMLAGVGKTAVFDLEHGKKTMRWSTIMAILYVLNIKIEFASPLMERYEKSTRKDA